MDVPEWSVESKEGKEGEGRVGQRVLTSCDGTGFVPGVCVCVCMRTGAAFPSSPRHFHLAADPVTHPQRSEKQH